MKKSYAAALVMALSAAVPGLAQSLDDLNLQVHGYATQAFLYTTQNNILTTNSSGGSPSWTEAVVNLTAKPKPQLRIAIQGRYLLLGTTGNTITLDYAFADYKVSEQAGFRFGKVKVPAGLLNEVQDIDPSYLWSLLPQSVYPILSRNALLSLDGGAGYGSMHAGSLGKIEYRVYGGEQVIGKDDGFLIPIKDAGLILPNGYSAVSLGGAVRWHTPIPGLMAGASDTRNAASVNSLTTGPYAGSLATNHLNKPNYFARLERNRVMFAGEFSRLATNSRVLLTGLPPIPSLSDARQWYVMASYRVSNKLSSGIYESQVFDHAHALGPARYSKDWALSARYDFNEYLYAKAEEHSIEGTAVIYDTANNAGGLAPNSKLTVLKIGISF